MGPTPDCEILLVHGIGLQDRREVVDGFQESLLHFLNASLRSQTRVTTSPVPPMAGLERGYDLTLAPAAPGEKGQASPAVTIRLREFLWSDLGGRRPPTVGGYLSLLAWLLRLPFRAHYGRFLSTRPSRGRRISGLLAAGWLFALLLTASLTGLILALVNAPFRGRYNFSARLAGLIMEYLRDISHLEREEIRGAVNQRLHRQINEVLALDNPRSLILVGHSLGNVFVLDQLKHQLGRPPVPLGWVSLGSPLWAVSLVDQGYVLPSQVAPRLDLGWYNLYDPLDPVGGPVYNPLLKNPDEQWYRARVNPLKAHTGYLADDWHMGYLWQAAVEGIRRGAPPAGERARAPRNRRLLRLGPFLRHSTPESLAVWTAHTAAGPHRAELWQGGDLVASQEAVVGHDEQLTHLWRFGGLEPETEYSFRVAWIDEAGHAWPLTRRNLAGEPLGQTPTAWALRTPPPPEEVPPRLLFASCHHPRHMWWDGDQGHAFISKVLASWREDPAARPTAQLFIGDQVYADDWWREQLLLPWPAEPERRRAQAATYDQVYDSFWYFHPWGELLRSAPSYMMWDDHDIRDGWGCNVHDFSGPTFSPEAREKFSAAGEAFRLHQGRGNPPSPTGDDFQFTLDLGPASVFVFDNRTCRAYREPCPMHPFGPEQMRRFQAWVEEKGPEKEVLIVATSSPGIFVKRWRLELGGYRLHGLMRWMERFLHWHGFDDDLRDQLPCPLNEEARDAILAGLAGFLRAHPPGAKRALWLGGDVHVGGYCRVPVGEGRQIEQWIASPISNRPNRGLYWLAAWALPWRVAGKGPGGETLRAKGFRARPARNLVTLELLPPAAPGQAHRVRGSLVMERGHRLTRLTRVSP